MARRPPAPVCLAELQSPLRWGGGMPCVKRHVVSIPERGCSEIWVEGLKLQGAHLPVHLLLSHFELLACFTLHCLEQGSR